MAGMTAVELSADKLTDHERRLSALEEDRQLWWEDRQLWREDRQLWRNLLALAPYAVQVRRVPVPAPRPPHADKVPLFPRRLKAGGHL